ncbi:nitrate- and nitrite sensing domain-containing protein [Streptomyces sp. NPDC101490]|uniref:sensor histidine kinase n=1 Tax=Streptomyces sp. NPDC101490 TaxID=3366143 RepID=UPI0037FD48EB
MRTSRTTKDAESPPPPSATARGRRAHAGPSADERPADEPPAGKRLAGAPEERASVSSVSSVFSVSSAFSVSSGGARSRPWPGHHRLRPRTVRAKVVSLLLVPVVSLLALWGFATVTTAQDIARLSRIQHIDAGIRRPVAAAVAALQDERRAAVRQVAAPATTRAAELRDRVRRTDEAVDRLRLDDTHTVGDSGGLPEAVGARVSAFVGRVEGLARLRTAAVRGRADWDQVYEEYTAAVSAGFAVGGALTGSQDTAPGSDARVLLEFGRAGETLSREDALLTSAHLTGHLGGAHLRAFTGAVDTRRTLTGPAAADLPPAGRAAWAALATGPDHTRLTRAEDRVLAAAPGRPAARAVTPAEWDGAVTAVRNGLAAIETRASAADRTDPLTGGFLSTGGTAVLLGLAAVAASLVISVRIGRGLVVELVSLRNTALGIAMGRLPAAMRRLRAGERIDVHAEAPPGPAAQDEIGQVGQALTTVHRAALSAAVERAELADGISGVFVNLARRSQILVHRQLNLLDTMERRADDPDELGDLFRLDHLTTRMRRHAESLIILSGAAPGRAWRTPVPLVDVVRAAVSEIEDYARVELNRLPETTVAGVAVADLTHLLAELIENAAQFSPPHTKVRVSGEPVGNGYALEIEDRGLGMGKEALAEANARITRSETLDLFDSDRLGLFVVSRLSSRQDVKVHLRTSPYGGTTAVVLLPADLLRSAPPHPVDDVPRAPRPRRAAAPPTTTGGHSGRPSGNHPSGRPSGNHPSGPGWLGDRHSGRHPDGTGPSGAPQDPRPGPSPARPAAVPARVPTDPGPAPAGVTALRPRGPSVPPPTLRTTAAGQRPDPTTPVTPTRPVSRTDHDGPTGHGAPTSHGGPTTHDTSGGDLPRRVRQMNLVPQLRGPAAPEPGPTPSAADPRTPEQVRDRMTAYREGWLRGGGPPLGSARPPATGRRPLDDRHPEGDHA